MCLYICVNIYIHGYLQGVYLKALRSFLDEKPQYFPSVLNRALSRQPKVMLLNFTALLPPHPTPQLVPSSFTSQRLLYMAKSNVQTSITFLCSCKDRYYSLRLRLRNIWLGHPPPVQKHVSGGGGEQKDSAEIRYTCSCTSAKG